MPKPNVISLISERQYNYKLCSPLQKRLHVTRELINRLGLEKELNGHSGCVNCLEWDTKGRKLASASDDFNVIIWDPLQYKKLQVFQTGHLGNIFSVKFMPETNENTIITGAGDEKVRVHDLVCKETTRICSCHRGRVKRLAVSSDSPDLYWSAAEDGVIRQFDLRMPHTCPSKKNIFVDLRQKYGEYIEAKCLAVNPVRPELIAVGANDPYIRIYDRRMIYPTDDDIGNCVQYFIPGHIRCKENQECSSTYVTFGPNGKDLLVNLGNELIYLYDIDSNKNSLLLHYPSKDYTEISEPLRRYCNGYKPEHFQSLLSKNKPSLPEHINALRLQANSYFVNEEYCKSIRVYNEAIQAYPCGSIFYSNRAAAYMKRDWCGDMYAALRDCITALSHDPSNVKAFFRLCRCLYSMGWYEEANAALNNFKQYFPIQAKSIACKALFTDIEAKLKSNKKEPSVPYITLKELAFREKARDYQQRFYGHCNTTTDIKEANFFGSDGQFIVAGSDDGSIFIWDRKTSNNIRILKGDSSIVNCLQPHPTYCLLATSGIEPVVRLWSPLPQDGSENVFEIRNHEEVASQNHKRMRSDPFDMVFLSMGIPRHFESDEEDTTTYCRTS